MKIHSVKYNFIMNAILTVAGIIFPLITFPYISRVLLVEGSGKVAFATSVVTYFTMFASLGIPTYGVRACAIVRDNKEKLSKTVQELLIISGGTTLLTYIVFGISLFVIPEFAQERTLLLIVGLGIGLNTIGVQWLYNALEQYSYITTCSILFKVIGMILMFLLVKESSDYQIYGGVYVIASFGSYVLNFICLRTVSYTHLMRDKLTHAGIYGVDASMSTLGQLYNTSIEFYARVNFTSLVEMVDALGGIDVISEQAFTTSDDSGLVMDVIQGENHFNGEQALAFARERQNVDGGDFQRGRNQQAVITAMIKKAISPAILTGANGLLNSVSGNVDTNMSTEQIQTLVKNQLSEGGAWNIKSMSAEGMGDTQECFSMVGTPLYVTQPDQNSVAAIQTAIAAVKAGETFSDSEIAQ